MKHFVFLAAAMLLPPALAAQITVASSTLEEHAAAPGERYTGTIRLHNASATPQEARVYQTDYRFLASGETFYDAPASTGRSNAGWLTFSPSRITLAPGESATITYTAEVPLAVGRGSYWSVLMVESVGPEGGAAARAGRVGIATTIRYAVQLATHVDQGERKIALEGAHLAGGPGDRAFQVDIVNTGDHADRLELRLELFNAEGVPAGRLRSERGLVYPGSSIRQRFELGHLPPGTYRALLVVDTDSDDVFGAEYTLQL